MGVIFGGVHHLVHLLLLHPLLTFFGGHFGGPRDRHLLFPPSSTPSLSGSRLLVTLWLLHDLTGHLLFLLDLLLLAVRSFRSVVRYYLSIFFRRWVIVR